MLSWASDRSSSEFPHIRHICLQILPRPFISTSAEQVFSAARFQTNPWSTSLNSDDFETRVTLAFNRNNLSLQDLATIVGWGPYLHIFNRRRQLQDDLTKDSGIPIGAPNRRDTSTARAKKAENAESRRSSLEVSAFAPAQNLLPQPRTRDKRPEKRSR
jgi:hypothetical protein